MLAATLIADLPDPAAVRACSSGSASASAPRTARRRSRRSRSPSAIMSRHRWCSRVAGARGGRRWLRGMPRRPELQAGAAAARRRSAARPAASRRASLADAQVVGGVRGRAAAGADPHGARRRTTTCGSRRRGSCRRRRSSGSRAPTSFRPSAWTCRPGGSERRRSARPRRATVGGVALRAARGVGARFLGPVTGARPRRRAPSLLATEWGQRAVIVDASSARWPTPTSTLRALDLQLDDRPAHAGVAAGVAAS